MAIGTTKRVNASSPGGQAFQAVGSRSAIVQVVSNAESTAASAPELLAPFSFAGSNAQWCRRGENITRGYFYCRFTASATVTTDPIIRIYGAIPLDPEAADADNITGAIPNDGTWRAIRLDNADWNAAGLTLDLVTSGSTLNNDATYAYSDETVEIDFQDCWYFIALCSTAANTSTGDVEIFARCLA